MVEAVLNEGLEILGQSEIFADGSLTRVSLPSTLRRLGTAVFRGSKLRRV